MSMHRQIAQMMRAAGSTPPVDDDWVNLWYFTSANGSAIDGSDQRGGADLNITGSLSISTVDGDYCVTKAANSDEMNVSLADLEIDITGQPDNCTFVLAYGVKVSDGKNMFCHNGDGAPKALGTYQRSSVGDRASIYTHSGSYYGISSGSPGTNNKGLIAWNNLAGPGYPLITLVNGVTGTVAEAWPNTYAGSDVTTMVFDSLSGDASSSYTYWAGLAGKTLTETELETLFSDWNTGGAGWRPGRA